MDDESGESQKNDVAGARRGELQIARLGLFVCLFISSSSIKQVACT